MSDDDFHSPLPPCLFLSKAPGKMYMKESKPSAFNCLSVFRCFTESQYSFLTPATRVPGYFQEMPINSPANALLTSCIRFLLPVLSGGKRILLFSVKCLNRSRTYHPVYAPRVAQTLNRGAAINFRPTAQLIFDNHTFNCCFPFGAWD
jgi:hypothetical protein